MEKVFQLYRKITRLSLLVTFSILIGFYFNTTSFALYKSYTKISKRKLTVENCTPISIGAPDELRPTEGNAYSNTKFIRSAEKNNFTKNVIGYDVIDVSEKTFFQHLFGRTDHLGHFEFKISQVTSCDIFLYFVSICEDESCSKCKDSARLSRILDRSPDESRCGLAG